jgi:hypothetical protein
MDSNDYLNQVVQQQAQVEGELRKRGAAQRPAPPQSPPPAASVTLGEEADVAKPKKTAVTRREAAQEAPVGNNAVDYRITGWWWQTVVVPPNAYVVHTRRGYPEPVNMGLGLSFSYDLYTDAFLVIPAAVQTLLINARCISSERQGVLVQAYVQWVIDDLKTAYRRLDFSDASDPMRIVNVQLREQAEAAIKDKVATMPIDAIMSDRQPIIEELTHRLRSVAEGGSGSEGLGLKIVTVQIKEAVVSSARLWENLQKPFRADRERQARLAELEAGQQIAQQELVNRQARETAELEARRRMEELRAVQQREAYDREQSEQARRHKLEQEAEQAKLAQVAATERARRQSEEELAAQLHQLEAAKAARELETMRREIELERSRAELDQLKRDRETREHEAKSAREAREVEVFHKRRVAENDMSEGYVKAQLIARLPQIAAAMPKPEELRQITVGGDGAGALTGLVAQLVGVIEGAVAKKNGA